MSWPNAVLAAFIGLPGLARLFVRNLTKPVKAVKFFIAFHVSILVDLLSSRGEFFFFFCHSWNIFYSPSLLTAI